MNTDERRCLAATRSGALRWAVVIAAILCIHPPSASAQFLLITRDLEVEPIRLLRVDDERIEFVKVGGDRRESLSLTSSIAILRDPAPAPPEGGAHGMLRLTDGRQFPGEPAPPASAAQNGSRDVLAWHSNWFGRMEVTLEAIDWITIARGAPAPAPGRADVVILANGDRLEGFITSIRKTVELEVDEGESKRTIEIPFDRIGAINMTTPGSGGGDANAVSLAGRRAWLSDGTIMDVRAIEVDDTGIVRLTTDPADGARGVTADRTRYSLDVRHLAAVVLTPGAMTPLAAIEPTEVSGPATRYVVPEPFVQDERALLGLSPIELRGPLSVSYAMPKGAKRFAAEVELPEEAWALGDFWFAVAVDGEEVVRERLNRARPRVNVNIALEGEGARTLTIQIESGEAGPVQNQAVLKRAMVLVE